MKHPITVVGLSDFIMKEYKNQFCSADLYNGKAGLSLALFIASMHLQDEKMENIAYDLIKESLALSNQADLSFETGLAGIGYTLLFLIENKYLDADFYDLFGKEYETIITELNAINQNPIQLLNSLKDIYFLSTMGRLKKDNRVEQIIRKIIEGCELFFTIQFYKFTNIHYLYKKIYILDAFNLYLRMVDYLGYVKLSPSLLEVYATLYRNGRVASSVETGYYLNRIIGNHVEEYNDVITENVNYGIINSHHYTQSLKEMIDLARFEHLSHNDLFLDYSYNDLMKRVDEKYNPLGYGAGLARLLIYLLNKDVELL